ncbi:bifunctional hydroxymethylpyrimidine kinase/phosphomethylpyrimidine kinase [Pseudooceanicola sp. 216_PA32_1]|uniref:hydroxymethylpyrimidine kinase n=1 Tax=Pseudooceanicola pacificus TaxID=2676438 RepID=A0A844WDX3_9RHOB|nr:bifunctional hydroxymethylpyrimidine kinase/phosphomethylpyrimidine kinase [Pseudooceanicola pacificus]MWB78672.1 bifunctional hydroxymethylpyrimidine kinase/phosphomethylpyrimidine kinase [Pseudooceanicola pacificus]
MTPTVLTIAGSDSGGGAGIQADLKTFSALGTYGASVITAVTAQNTTAVSAVHPIPCELIAAQIAAVLADIEVHAVKIGMLGSPEVVACVAGALAPYAGPVVLDPVMVAKSGDALLPDDAVSALVRHLLPRATLLTPNLPEAARLLDACAATDDGQMQDQGRRLLQMGAGAVLMKGGHGTGETCTDWLITASRAKAFRARRIATTNTHGTGCSLSSAIAAGLARGLTLPGAVERAHGWLQGAIRAADGLRVGRGHGPVHHFHEVWG